VNGGSVIWAHTQTIHTYMHTYPHTHLSSMSFVAQLQRAELEAEEEQLASNAAAELDLEDRKEARHLVLSRADIHVKGKSPTARCGMRMVFMPHPPRVLIFGGADSDSILGDAHVLDLSTNTWEEVKTTGFSCPGPSFGYSATPSPSGTDMYVFGGLTKADTYNFEATSSPSNSTSASGVGHATGLSVGARRYKSAKQTERAVFEDEEATSELYTFDLDLFEWTQPIVIGTPPTPRYMHSACLLGKYLVVYGGCQCPAYHESLDDLYVFDTEQLKWTQPECSGSRPSARHGHTAVALDSTRMLIFGGANEDGKSKNHGVTARFNDVHILDTSDWSWSQPNISGTAPRPRAFHTSGVIGSEKNPRLFISAGECSQTSSDTCILDLKNMAWIRPLHDSIFDHELHASTVMYDTIITFGGLNFEKGLRDTVYTLSLQEIQPAAQNDYTFKIVLVGDSQVGKSSLMKRFIEDSYTDMHLTTIGIDFSALVTIIDGKVIKLHVWDTAGQERFAQVTSHYYRGADGVVLVYDITNALSLRNIHTWNNAVDDANTSGHRCARVLAGNKCDSAQYRQVSTQQAKAMGKAIDAIHVFETSALDSTNVDAAFLSLARHLLAQRLKDSGKSGNGSSGFKIGRQNGSTNKKKCCS
jgi:Ras-related protein Rab-1A